VSPEESLEGVFGLLDSFVSQALQLEEVPRTGGAGGQVFTGATTALIKQLIEFLLVPASVSEVGKPVLGGLVAGVGEFTKHVMIALADARMGLVL
jgi:hypothetical protein